MNNEVKSDSDDSSLFLRNFKERQEMKYCVKSWSENDLRIIFKFLKERVMQPLYKHLKREGDSNGPKASWRQWVARRRLHWLKNIISEQFEQVTSRSGSHRYGTEGNSSASESNSDYPDSSYVGSVNGKFPVGSFVYVNGWRGYDGVGQVKNVKLNNNGPVILYSIMRVKQMIFYDVPEGVLTIPTEEEMAQAPERWRREQGNYQLTGSRREMRAIIDEMEWDKSLNKYIPVRHDLTNNVGDLYADLFFKMHREISEEIIISASCNKYILNPYNEAFWCKSSIKMFRTILLHLSSFELSPCPKLELSNNIYIASSTAAKEIKESNTFKCVDNVCFQQKSLSKKYYEQSCKEKSSGKQNSACSCNVSFFDLTPATCQQFSQLKSTEADLQAYYDVLELCNMEEARYVSISDLIVKDTPEVSIAMTKAPWNNSQERLSDVIPRSIDVVKSGYVEVHRYWYLWHQILSVVHPLATQIKWVEERANDDGHIGNDVDGGNLYTLKKVILSLGINFNDMQLMNF